MAEAYWQSARASSASLAIANLDAHAAHRRQLPSRLRPIGTKFIAMKGKLQPAAAPGCGRSRAYLRRRADAPRDRRAIAKRHFVRRRCETALCGGRRKPSPGLGRDPSSAHTRASAAQLRPGVQPLRGLGSGALPLRCRTIAVRMRRSCGRLSAAKSPSVLLRAARGCDDAAAVRVCVRVANPLLSRSQNFCPDHRISVPITEFL